MNRFNKFLAAAFMSAAMLLPNMTQAMDIRFASRPQIMLVAG
jgi:hypothetical protein